MLTAHHNAYDRVAYMTCIQVKSVYFFIYGNIQILANTSLYTMYTLVLLSCFIIIMLN